MKNRLWVLALVLFLLLFSGCSIFSFRDSGLEATLSALESQVFDLTTRSAHDAEVISYLATRVGAVYQTPAPVENVPTPSQMGERGVLIEEGACCVGGTAGETIEIEAAFDRENLGMNSVLTEMRVRSGGRLFNALDFEGIPWEPFTPEMTFSYEPPINWSGFYVCVQYRDADGSSTGVFCDDISVEGNPAPPES